jgi:hypothetical protein
MDQAIIIGAGFSSYAGLPLQAAFTKQLLDTAHYTKGPSKRLVDYLCPFVSQTFHPREEHDPDRWPDLEDLFTCIDLSANSGHHLGNEHSPSVLRTVRRALIARTIRMLRQAYEQKQRKPDEKWRALESLLGEIAASTNAFISLNWDTVAEERMLELHHGTTIHYGTGFTPARVGASGNKIKAVKHKPTAPRLRVAKIHGSINWLYCDNCRNVYWFDPDESLRIADQLLSKDEWQRIAPTAPANAKEQLECPACDGVVLTTRIATFSYRKALDFPMFHQSWSNAEQILKQAKRWVFIGYSLPAADYEFKYLLKRIELARPKPPDIIVVTGGDGATTTRDNFRHFFGTRLNKRVFNDGLTDEAIRYIITT